MRKTVAAVLITAMFPVFSYALTNEEIRAQINALLAEIAQLQQVLGSATAQGSAASSPPVSGGSSAICSVSRYPISRGATGRDVSLLQQFLKDRGFFSGDITTFFGALTEAALTNFQLQSGIIETRSEGGVFGRRTFNYILGRFCTSPSSTVTPVSTPVYPPPTQCVTPPTIPAITCGGSWVKTYSSACHVGWTCVATTTQATATPSNKPPLISALVGPTKLKPDEAGTWKIDATDPEQGALLYSMVWGDEGAILSQLLNIAREGTKYSSTTSYTHAYAKTGTYAIVAFAKDPAGNDTTALLSVEVRLPEGTVGGPGLSIDGSCALNGKVTKSNEMIPNPTCSGTCSYPYLQCIAGQWVAITSGGGSGSSSDSSISGACILDGVGYAADNSGGGSTRSGSGSGSGGGSSGGGGGGFSPNTQNIINSNVQNSIYNSFSPRIPAAKDAFENLASALVAVQTALNNLIGLRGEVKGVCVDAATGRSCDSPGGLTCTTNGWVGAAVYNHTGTRVACMSKNGLFVPAGIAARGNTCDENGNDYPNCEKYYLCRRDGWWLSDPYGNWTQKQSSKPWIYPEWASTSRLGGGGGGIDAGSPSDSPGSSSDGSGTGW